eukprot:COSAG02_NODE_67256_length_253_cov_0.727273_1_plen_68_part_10
MTNALATVMCHDQRMVTMCGDVACDAERDTRTDMDSLLLSIEPGITCQTNAYAYLDVLRAKPALRKIY